jgi:hypothetical protein
MTPHMRRRYPVAAAGLLALICIAVFIWTRVL